MAPDYSRLHQGLRVVEPVYVMIRDRKHIRLRNYDYASDGWYFVTICTRDGECFFGHIKDKIMYNSPIGEQANLFWQEIPKHFPQVELGEFVVMPNHIHGMIGIDNDPDQGDRRVVACNDPTDDRMDDRTDDFRTAVACNSHSDDRKKNKHMASISPKPGTLSTMMRSYKSAVTKWCNDNHISNFAWQSRFHDHVIRNQEEFDRIEHYIITNIENWDKDKFYT